jgi:general secretion pathway protein G
MLKRLQEARKNEKGFTLIELLIVIVILGVLAGIVVFAVGGVTDRGKTSACKSDVKNVEVAAEAYFAQNGNYPPTATVSTILVPSFLHSYPSDVTYTLNTGGTAFTAIGVGGTVSATNPTGCP